MSWLRAVGVLGFLALTVFVTPSAEASVITIYYGDDDGFGVGAVVGGNINENDDNAEVGEAEGTDTRLIGLAFLAPPFVPTGSFDAFLLPAGETVVGATLTIRMGGFDSGPNPVDAGDGFPNQIVLDGIVDTSLLALFTTLPGTLGAGLVEEFSIALSPTVLAALGDGSVSLLGTHISEDAGSGSFQIDFLRIDIETVAAPEPSILVVGAVGLGLLALRGRR
jgi:hypothetical protein